MLGALKRQIEDLKSASSSSELPLEYGHAIGVIAQVGQDEARCGEGTEDAQIKRMKEKAAEEVVKHGLEILKFLRPELRALIEPDDLEKLQEEHEVHLSKRERRE
jgi:hypothetical protein